MKSRDFVFILLLWAGLSTCSHAKHKTGLYEVPESEHYFMSKDGIPHHGSASHFPDAEAEWLQIASSGQIGDDVKSDDESSALNATIEEWKNRAYAEKKFAFSEGLRKAIGEYRIYNTSRGQAIFQFVGMQSLSDKPKGKHAKGKHSGIVLYNVPDSEQYFASQDGIPWKGASSHFPDAEVDWLGQAASGQIGDDEKTDADERALTATIQEWSDRAYA